MNQIISESPDSKNHSTFASRSKAHHYQNNKKYQKNILKKTNLDPFQKPCPGPQTLETSSGSSFDISNIGRNITPVPGFKGSSSSFPFFIQEPIKKARLRQKDSKHKSLINDSEKSFSLIGKTMTNTSKKKRTKVIIFNKKIAKKHFDNLTSPNPSFQPTSTNKPYHIFNDSKLLIKNKDFLPSIHKSSSFQGLTSQNPSSNSREKQKNSKKNDLKFSMTIKGWDWT